MPNNDIYDAIIIGAGAAGCSAGIYATRYSLKTLMLSGPMPGGLITEASEVENYPGHISISGQKLGQLFLNQAVKLGIEYKTEVVKNIMKEGVTFKVQTSNLTYKSKSVILATGTKHKKLDISGESQFTGRGVSYCTTCDAPFFKGKSVAIVGGGNSAVEGAQDLALHAKKVYLIYRSELKAAPTYINDLRKKPKIIEIGGTNVIEIKGKDIVENVVLDKEYEGSTKLKVDGLFVQIGYTPKNGLAKALGIKLSRRGYVKVDQGMGSSVEGVFCAGDLNNYSNQLHQQVTSASEGAISAQSAYRFIQGLDYILVED